MVTEIRIYFEGNRDLKRGFHSFFSKLHDLARSKNCQVRWISTGGKPVPDYRDALCTHPNAWNVLLKDSDRPDSGRLFQELSRQEKLNASLADSVFWMVQVMESWFLADSEALGKYYGQGLKARLLRANPEVEQIRKEDVLRKLRTATKDTQKGEYDKRKHAPDLLSRIDPERVSKASPNCRRIFDIIAEKLSS